MSNFSKTQPNMGTGAQTGAQHSSTASNGHPNGSNGAHHSRTEVNFSESPETENRLIGAMSGARSDAQEIIEKTESGDMTTQQGQIVRDAVEDLLKSPDDFAMLEIAENIKARGYDRLVSFDTLSKCRIEYRVACDAAGSPEKAVEELIATLKRCRVRRDMETALFEAFKATRDGKPTADITEAIECAREAVSRSLQPKGEPRFTRIKLRETFNRARLEYLIQGIFLEIGTGVVTNSYGGFKSFVFGVDLGLCVATGKNFFGRAVKRGPVVYILAEGAYETEARAKAWLQYHGIEEIPDNFEIIEMPVQIADATQRAALISDLREMSPSLVILDTLAKCNLGSDENDAKDMGLFTNGMEVIARELGAFVLAIHHNNKGGTARGSVSLPANVDASIVLKSSPGRVVTVECDRVKGAPFEAFTLIGRLVTLPELDHYGNNITSLVFEPTDEPVTAERAPSKGKTERTADAILEVLVNLRKNQSKVTKTEWAKKVVDAGICKKTACNDHVRALEDLGKWTWQFGDCVPNLTNSENAENAENAGNGETEPGLFEISDFSDFSGRFGKPDGNGKSESQPTGKTKRQKAAAESEPHLATATDERERGRL